MVRKTHTGAHEGSRGGVYLYNLVQAQFFLDHGLRPVAVGRGSRGDVFLMFARDEATEEVFQNWNAYVQRVKPRGSDDDEARNPSRSHQ